MPVSKEVSFEVICRCAADAVKGAPAAQSTQLAGVDDHALRSALARFAKARAEFLAGLSASHVGSAVERMMNYVPFVLGLMEQLPELGVSRDSTMYTVPGIQFSWFTVVSERFRTEPMVSSSLQLELVFVLYSLGLALRKQAQDMLQAAGRDDAALLNDCKNICGLLQRAAGVFEYVACDVLPKFDVVSWPRQWHKAPELRGDLHRCLALISIAEAQTLIAWRGAHKSGTSFVTAGRLLSGAFVQFERASQLRDAFSCEDEPRWKALQNYALNGASVCRGLAFLCKGCDLFAREQVGPAVALLQRAQAALSTHSVWHAAGQHVYWSVCGQASQQCVEQLQLARKENDFVYFQPVPLDHEEPDGDGDDGTNSTALPKPFVIAKELNFEPPAVVKLPVPTAVVQSSQPSSCSLM